MSHDPNSQGGIDPDANDTYTYVSLTPDLIRQPVIVTNGKTYQHCDTDVDGCWLYRVVDDAMVVEGE